MLTDLARNDIGRIAKIGSVKVTEFAKVEHYSHVMHLVSLVEGELSTNKSGIDVLCSLLPAGTLSGAPKIRAMEIIDELENTRRGPYGGAAGYLSFDGSINTCITIRTALITGGKIHVQAGAGIVADSQPESEYVESVNKAAAMIAAIEQAGEYL
jgi:anthranilate synthase component 1